MGHTQLLDNMWLRFVLNSASGQGNTDAGGATITNLRVTLGTLTASLPAFHCFDFVQRALVLTLPIGTFESRLYVAA